MDLTGVVYVRLESTLAGYLLSDITIFFLDKGLGLLGPVQAMRLVISPDANSRASNSAELRLDGCNLTAQEFDRVGVVSSEISIFLPSSKLSESAQVKLGSRR